MHHSYICVVLLIINCGADAPWLVGHESGVSRIRDLLAQAVHEVHAGLLILIKVQLCCQAE